MRRNGAISDADASLAKAYPLQLGSKTESGEVAPYFVEWVRQQLDEKFGARLYEQGLKVYTTLDLDMQSAAERALENQLRAIEGGKVREVPASDVRAARGARGERRRSGDAELAVPSGRFHRMDPRDGSVRALVGGRSSTIRSSTNDPGASPARLDVQAHRLLGRDRERADARDDHRRCAYHAASGRGRSVDAQNYDGKFEGPIPLRRALYMSRNLPAIRTGMELGEQTCIDMAKRFGITSTIPPYPSIAIGSADVFRSR
jgi:penicillin-binding protein 1A